MADPSVRINLDVNAEGATKALKGFSEVTKKAGKVIETSFIKGLVKATALIGTFKVGITAVTSVVKGVTTEFSANADQLNKLSESLGITVEQLSLMKRQSELASVSFEQFSIGVKTLSKNVADFERGSGEAKVAFDAMGISVARLRGKGPNELIETLADEFRKLEDGPKKTAFAMKIFGESGTALIPLLNQGSEALREQREEIIALGGVLSKDAADKATLFEDAMTKLNFAFDGLKQTIAIQVIPTVTDLIERFVDFFTRVRPQMQTFVKAIPLLFKLMFHEVREIFKDGIGAPLREFVSHHLNALFSGMKAAVSAAGDQVWSGLKEGARAAILASVGSIVEGLNVLMEKAKSAFIILKKEFSADAAAKVELLEGANTTIRRSVAFIAETQQRINDGALRAGETVEVLQSRIEATQKILHSARVQKQRLESDLGIGGGIGLSAESLFGDANVAASQSVKEFGEAFKNAFEAVAMELENVEQTRIGEALKNLPAKIAAVMKVAAVQVEQDAKKLQEALDAPSAGATGGLAGAGDQAAGPTTFFGGFVKGLEEAQKKLNDFAAEGAAVATNLFQSFATGLDQFIFDSIKRGFREIDETAKAFARSMVETISKMLIQIATNRLFAQIFGAILGPGAGAAAGVAAPAVVPNADGGIIRHGITPLAEGGIVSRPTLAAIRERGQDEAVVPLPKNRKIPVELSGGGGATINIAPEFRFQSLDGADSMAVLKKNEQGLKNLMIELINTQADIRAHLRGAAQ